MDSEALETYGINHVALVGTYPPRRCGVAAFTKNLRDALAERLNPQRTLVVAMDTEYERIGYPVDVGFQVRTRQPADYRLAADMININQIDATIIQHEFGIYGGQEGNLLLEALGRLRMPVITALHTVVREPGRVQRELMAEIADLSSRLVVMSQDAGNLLREVYNVSEARIACIPHGVPDLPFEDPAYHKDRYGLQARTVVLTFGFLTPDKGIETMIQALPGVVEKHPDVTYVVLGATHPNVLREQGDAYRNALERLVLEKRLKDHVRFQNRFVAHRELCGWVGAADIDVTPYRNPDQAVSGALALAMGAGKAIVSTPYAHAREMLAGDRGCLTPFDAPEALADNLIALIEDPDRRNAMRKAAYDYCRSMVWREVAGRYLAVARDAIDERKRAPQVVHRARPEFVSSDALPEVNLGHLRTMTDDTGIYQHAIHTIPDRNHGYCTDDNARALVVALRHYHIFRDESVLPMVATYLAFLHGAFHQEQGCFRNFMAFDRRWLEERGSDDSHARALWALGEAVALAPNDGVLGYTTRLFSAALPLVRTFSYHRSWAFALIGMHAYLRRFAGDSQVRRARDELAGRLYDLFQREATDDWPWCEDIVTYSNARIPHALILCGESMPHGGMLDMGLKSLRWLLDVQTNEQGSISVIGCDGWLKRDGTRARFDQQPVELMGLAEACGEAYRATGDEQWGREARRCVEWFLGRNDTGGVLYDFKTGGSRDGLNPQGTNQNEGAESTLAWLTSILTLYELMTDKPVPRLSTIAQDSPTRR